ncbi:hypothetical protein VTN02DRAFT_4176 [Thermoascus thermophilus]
MSLTWSLMEPQTAGHFDPGADPWQTSQTNLFQALLVIPSTCQPFSVDTSAPSAVTVPLRILHSDPIQASDA